ncbi:SIS domain-containing protein [Arthrobacter sp. ov118]|uniref:SIS domain-containing protein n=1 Tax=Arthrobacter sp. ov118 TaxID=1761747 RepID=UPI0008F07A4E|nr:SIS domain-containing protein [Arthrobacter sp. ov118]SFU11305.1 SIS domain-containing protein [Arthrobacter sp. ov118]
MEFLPKFAHIPSTIAEVAGRELDPGVVHLARQAQRVRIVAMGGSFNAATAAVERFLERGIDARAELASHLLHSSIGTVAKDELVVLVSYSGTSVETIRAAEALRDQGHNGLVCITNAPASELSAACDAVIDQGLTEETHVPFGPWTTTYLALFRLACAMADQPFPDTAALAPEAERLLTAAGDILALQPAAPGYIEFFGRGAFAATAVQATLIAREIARVPAASWESSTYRHGPIEAISPTQLSVVFAARDGRPAGLDSSFASGLREIVDNVIVVGPGDSNVPVRVTDDFTPLLSLVVPAVLSYAWGMQAGIPAGEFRYTSHSVTDEDELTREG